MYEKILSVTPGIAQARKVVVSLSGGLDSTTLLYLLAKRFRKENVFALSFNYNQRHDIELTQAKRTCKKLGIAHKIIDLQFLGEIARDVSAMVKGSVATPTMGDLEDQKKVSTYVPFRNTILTGITFAFAETVGADAIALGVQYGDYAATDGSGSRIYHYWDCSNDFTKAMQAVADLNDKHSIKFIAPFVSLTKADELELGKELEVPYEDTWTCYAGKSDEGKMVYIKEPMGGKETRFIAHYQPCGICPSCVGRAEAFKQVGMIDPVVVSGVWDDQEGV